MNRIGLGVEIDGRGRIPFPFHHDDESSHSRLTMTTERAIPVSK